MTNKTRILIESDFDGLGIGVLIVEPDEEPRAVVQFVHGISEHKERYLPAMEYLAGKGYACIIHDHRGHGESIKSKNDIGYTYKKGWVGIVSDMHQVTEFAKDRWQGKSFFIFAHSMGTLAARVYLKKYDYEADGMILCGAPSNNKAAFFGIMLINLMAIFKSSRYRSDLMQDLMMGSVARRCEDKSSEMAWLSASKKNVEAFENDELCGFIFTLNGFKSILKLFRQVYSSRGWNAKKETLPIWFIAGRDDPWIRGKNRFLQSIRFLKEMGYENVSYRLYNGLRHELLNEDVAEIIYEEIYGKLQGWEAEIDESAVDMVDEIGIAGSKYIENKLSESELSCTDNNGYANSEALTKSPAPETIPKSNSEIEVEPAPKPEPEPEPEAKPELESEPEPPDLESDRAPGQAAPKPNNNKE